MTAAEITERVKQIKNWRHIIELPGGILTPGTQDARRGMDEFRIPADLTGKTVLDIGCSDGGYSFLCEKRGATVLAVDDYSSVFIDSSAGFRLAHELLQSKVQFKDSSLFDLDPRELGTFDVVLFLGVLYHLTNPLGALEKLASLCGDMVVIETLIAKPVPRWFRQDRRGSYMAFYEGDEINQDPTIWCAPTIDCLKAMLRACGFCNVTTISAVERGALPNCVVHAFSPKHGHDVEQFLRAFEPKDIASAYESVIGSGMKADPISSVKAVSAAQYAAMKQRLLRARSSHFHQVTRWAG